MKAKILAALCGLLFMASSAFATVTITGNVIDDYGNPAVGVRVVEYPLKWTIAGGSLVLPNQVATSTDASGNWSMTVVGGVLAAIFVPPGNNIPYGLIQATLPTSGTVTYATLAAQQPNVLTAFPPSENLNMGGFGFTNMAGATAVGGAMAYGTGLGSPQLFSTTGSHTYTIPTNATIVEAAIFGAGGGGGGSVGGGGGGGQLVRCWFLASGGTGTIVIGTGGTGGASGANGTDGTDTTFTQTSGAECDAGGGVHGTHGAPGSGGAGGSAGTTVTGGAVQEVEVAGTNGANGSGGTGGTGGSNGGPGGGGNGGSTGNAGTNGGNGIAVVWGY